MCKVLTIYYVPDTILGTFIMTVFTDKKQNYNEHTKVSSGARLPMFM